MPPERNNSVVDAASPAHQRFVLPLFSPQRASVSQRPGSPLGTTWRCFQCQAAAPSVSSAHIRIGSQPAFSLQNSDNSQRGCLSPSG